MTRKGVGSRIDVLGDFGYDNHMPRRIRASAGGIVYHVLNRGVGRMRLFRKAADFAAMEKVLEEALKRTPVRLLAYCILSNHWHLLTVARYIERNPLRAGMVGSVEEWQWSSLWRRCQADAALREILSDWPVEAPRDWFRWVQQPQTEAELEAVRRSVRRGRPFGEDRWARRIAMQFGLESTFRSPGRQPKTMQP